MAEIDYVKASNPQTSSGSVFAGKTPVAGIQGYTQPTPQAIAAMARTLGRLGLLPQYDGNLSEDLGKLAAKGRKGRRVLRGQLVRSRSSTIAHDC